MLVKKQAFKQYTYLCYNSANLCEQYMTCLMFHFTDYQRWEDVSINIDKIISVFYFPKHLIRFAVTTYTKHCINKHISF